MSRLFEVKAMKIPSSSVPVYQRIIVGDGPAGMQHVLTLLERKFAPDSVMWIDDKFNGGAFNKELLNVEGNTSIGKYIKTFNEMFTILEKFNIVIDKTQFALYQPTYDQMFAKLAEQKINIYLEKFKVVSDYKNPQDFCCPLSMVKPILQLITDKLRTIVYSAQGKVQEVNQLGQEVIVTMLSADNKNLVFKCHNIVLAIGGQPKSLSMLEGYDSTDPKSGRELSPRDFFSVHKLHPIVAQNPEKFKKIYIIGDGHSAALIQKNILLVREALDVKELRPVVLGKRPYKFRYNDSLTGAVINNHDGLDGNVKLFISALLENNSKYKGQWDAFCFGMNVTFKNIPGDGHIVCGTGFQTANTLLINKKTPLDFIDQDKSNSSEDNRIHFFGLASRAVEIGITKFKSKSDELEDKLSKQKKIIECVNGLQQQSVKLSTSMSTIFTERVMSTHHYLQLAPAQPVITERPRRSAL